MKKLPVILSMVALAAATATAQQKPAPKMAAPASPITTSMKAYYDSVKTWLTMAASQMPEADYSFHPATQPAPDKAEIRTFGAILAHVADANFLFCGAASGMKAPADMSDNEHTKKTKADIQKALSASFDFCDRAWAATTDRNASTAADLPEVGKSTRLGGLAFNTSHDAEHYGNVVTYLRAKGMVPPSSQPRGK